MLVVKIEMYKCLLCWASLELKESDKILQLNVLEVQ